MSGTEHTRTDIANFLPQPCTWRYYSTPISRAIAACPVTTDSILAMSRCENIQNNSNPNQPEPNPTRIPIPNPDKGYDPGAASPRVLNSLQNKCADHSKTHRFRYVLWADNTSMSR